jgi:ubiquitin carboxyl-terminal hydrolase 9/24
MNIDCQIRNKSTIHEALSTLCEDEIMDGDNKVLCEECKVKTNTVLRTAISALPDVLILSLKRFDLDYTTFETVKLNSRCEFEEALNMKQYTLEAKELLEAASNENPKSETGSMMDLGEDEVNKDPLSKLPDDEYDYRLVGVLVHAGVAQGGHYYSFIKDRTSDKWYRFDDEDVTPFDPSLIEQECFGGKIKKETKFPNGHVHTVENEQFANALMLLYEKVKPVEMSDSQEGDGETATRTHMEEEVDTNMSLTNGYDVFLPSVTKSNSTHSWQTFLLTQEFQGFMSEFLSHATNLPHSGNAMVDGQIAELPQFEHGSWPYEVVQLALSFLFDLLLHLSLDKNVLDRWSAKVTTILTTHPSVTEAFVSNIAQTTRCVNQNWIRAYTVECSDEAARRTAQQIFVSAIRKQLEKKNEQQLLHKWTCLWSDEWKHKLGQLNSSHQNSPMPTDILAEHRSAPGPKTSVPTTNIGTILSFVTLLLELSPRIVQSRIELFYFIGLLARAGGTEGHLLRAAMTHAQIPTRLICLAWREKFQNSAIPQLGLLKVLFPGACLSSSLAIGMCKHESQNVLQLGMNNAGGGNQFSLYNYDIRLCLEAFACILGVPWCIYEDITYDTGEVSRGRTIIRLTPLAVKAITAVFEESKTTSSKGLTKKEIQLHLKRCGMRDIPPQRLDQIINKHAIIDEEKEINVLPLEGFLEYYQTYASSNNEHQASSYCVPYQCCRLVLTYCFLLHP